MERYRFILAEEAHSSVVPICRLLGVSRSGFCGWRKRGDRDRDRNARTASFDAEFRAAHLKSDVRYGSRRRQRELHAVGLGCSMSRKGNCCDNAPAEGLFATLNVEELRHFELNTRGEARDRVLRYILLVQRPSVALKARSKDPLLRSKLKP